MARLPIDELRDDYDDLVKKIIDNLKRIIVDLMKQKEIIMKKRKANIESAHQTRNQAFIASREEFYADAAEKKQEISKNDKERIGQLDEELKKLLITELQVDGTENKSHDYYQNAINVTIGQLNGLLNYIHQNSGAGRRLFGSNKGKRRHLPVRAIYDRITQLYAAIKKQEIEEELNDEQFNRFKLKVEAAADDILDRLVLITKVRKDIRKPRTARVMRDLKRARQMTTGRGSTVSQATGAVKGALGDAGLRAVIAKENAAAAIGGVIGKIPNPIPSLRNWLVSIGNTAGNLRRKTRRKGADVSEEIAEAGAEIAPEAEELYTMLTRIINEVREELRESSPQESAKLGGLGNRLRESQSRIFKALRTFWDTGSFTQPEIEKAAAELEGATKEAEETIVEIERELSKWQQLRGWLSSRTPDINIRGRLAGARRAVAGKVPGWLKQNPLPSLRKWVSRVGNNAKKLEEAEKGGKDISQALAVLTAEQVTEVEVRKRVNVLLRVAQGIRNFNPQKSAQLMRLANWIGELTGRIFANLKKLGEPNITKEEAEKTTAEIIETETELQRAIMEAVATKPTGITREDLIMPDIKKLNKEIVDLTKLIITKNKQIKDMTTRLKGGTLSNGTAVKGTIRGSNQDKEIKRVLKIVKGERDALKNKLIALKQAYFNLS